MDLWYSTTFEVRTLGFVKFCESLVSVVKFKVAQNLSLTPKKGIDFFLFCNLDDFGDR